MQLKDFFSRILYLFIALAIPLFVLSGCQFWPSANSQNNASLTKLSPKNFVLPSAAPLRIAENKAPERHTEIFNLGDMMLDRNVQKRIDEHGPDYLFEKIASSEWFKDADVISANLEGPFADKRRPTSKSIAFRFDPDLLYSLIKYRITLLSQANNHSFDMGAAGFAESQQNLRLAGIDFYGSQYKVDANSLLLKKIGDFNFGFIGANDTNTRVKAEAIIELIKKARQQGTDFVVVNLHWGEEYKEISNTRQRILGKELIDAGADVIIGHHPHVVEEMEVYKNRPIFYSLGNFIFDQYFSTSTQIGLGVGLTFKEKEINVHVFPLIGHNSQVSIMIDETANQFMTNWIAKSRLGDYQFNNFDLEINL